MKTGYIVAIVAVVGGLIYFLSRQGGKLTPGATAGAGTGTGGSTSNAVMNLTSSILNLGAKLVPKSSNTSSTSPSLAGNNSGLNFADWYPGNDESGSGVADGGT